MWLVLPAVARLAVSLNASFYIDTTELLSLGQYLEPNEVDWRLPPTLNRTAFLNLTHGSIFVTPDTLQLLHRVHGVSLHQVLALHAHSLKLLAWATAASNVPPMCMVNMLFRRTALLEEILGPVKGRLPSSYISLQMRVLQPSDITDGYTKSIHKYIHREHPTVICKFYFTLAKSVRKLLRNPFRVWYISSNSLSMSRLCQSIAGNTVVTQNLTSEGNASRSNFISTVSDSSATNATFVDFFTILESEVHIGSASLGIAASKISGKGCTMTTKHGLSTNERGKNFKALQYWPRICVQKRFFEAVQRTFQGYSKK